jgi:hypothetical protein
MIATVGMVVRNRWGWRADVIDPDPYECPVCKGQLLGYGGYDVECRRCHSHFVLARGQRIPREDIIFVPGDDFRVVNILTVTE